MTNPQIDRMHQLSITTPLTEEMVALIYEYLMYCGVPFFVIDYKYRPQIEHDAQCGMTARQIVDSLVGVPVYIFNGEI